ncbi:MAG: hypothetical protein WAU36_18575 [Cyclobacteriaceae bacterium]
MDRLILVVMFFGVSLGVRGQDVSMVNLEWNVKSSFDVQTGFMDEGESKLITHADKSIEWLDWDGTTKYTFQVSNIRGHWVDVNRSGSITYNIKSGELEGILSIERSNSNWLARIMLTTMEEPVIYELTLNSVQKL